LPDLDFFTREEEGYGDEAIPKEIGDDMKIIEG